jgi:RNase P/RNase MRP subunit p29
MIETESTGATAKVIEETTETIEQTTETAEAEVAEEITYHAVEKDGEITAIWEMQGKKHLRTIHPRSAEGKKIMALFETAA